MGLTRPVETFKHGVCFCLGLAITIFIFNLALVIWASTGNTTDEGSRVLQQGSCSAASRTNTLAHVAINVLSTLLLAASKHCMQICIAPTRPDIDKAHAARKWLSIGVPSLRNLGHVSWLRRSCWALLCISSLPLHLIYNSAVFQTLVTNEYTAAVLDESYLWPNSSFTVPEEMVNVQIVWHGDDTMRVNTNASARGHVFDAMLTESRNWDNLSLMDCARLYAQPLLSLHRTLVVVKTHDNAIGDNPFVEYYVAVSNNGWMCSGADSYSGNDLNTPTNLCSASETILAQDSRPSDSPAPLLYCLAEPIQEECTVEVSQAIIIAVCVANAIKLAAICVVLVKVSGYPIVTIGDAIASFIRTQDSTTYGLCAEDRDSIDSAWKLLLDSDLPRGRVWSVRTRRQWHNISRSKRVFSLIAVAASLAAITVLLAMAIRADVDRGTNFTGNTFLSKPPNVIIGYESLAGLSLSAIVILVNTPQLICSLLYFYYNSLLTNFCQAKEWNAFSLGPKTLRVSSRPQGQQRSSYYLSLPFRFAIPLLILSGVLHWLISQTIFMLKVAFRNFDGGPSERFGGAGYGNIYGDHPGELLTSSYNTQGIMYCLITAVIAYVVLCVLGSRRLKGDMVVAGTSSAAISAACVMEFEGGGLQQRRESKALADSYVPLQPDNLAEGWLMWGDYGQTVRCRGQTSDGLVPAGHLRLGSGSPEPPIPGKTYA